MDATNRDELLDSTNIYAWCTQMFIRQLMYKENNDIFDTKAYQRYVVLESCMNNLTQTVSRTVTSLNIIKQQITNYSD